MSVHIQVSFTHTESMLMLLEMLHRKYSMYTQKLYGQSVWKDFIYCKKVAVCGKTKQHKSF